jgi:hypothetical protein
MGLAGASEFLSRLSQRASVIVISASRVREAPSQVYRILRKSFDSIEACDAAKHRAYRVPGHINGGGPRRQHGTDAVITMNYFGFGGAIAH